MIHQLYTSEKYVVEMNPEKCEFWINKYLVDNLRMCAHLHDMTVEDYISSILTKNAMEVVGKAKGNALLVK